MKALCPGAGFTAPPVVSAKHGGVLSAFRLAPSMLGKEHRAGGPFPHKLGGSLSLWGERFPMSDSCDSLSPFQDGFRVRQTQGMGHDSRLNEHTKGGRKVGEGAKGRGERTSSDEDLNPVPDSLPADGADSQGLAALKAGAMSALEDQFDLVVDADRAGDALLHLAVAAL